MNSKSSKEHFAEVWRKKAQVSPLTKEYITGENERTDKALQLFEGGKNFLDIGCGTGILANQLRDRFEVSYGLDIAEQATRLAKQVDVKTIVTNVDECGLPFKDSSIDFISAMSVFQFIRNIENLLTECHRVLSDHGKLAFTVPNMRTVGKIFRLVVLGRFSRTSFDPVGYDGGTVHYFCYRNIVELLQKTGFKVEIHSGIFVRPHIMTCLPERGPLSSIKHEFLSGEMFIIAQKIPHSQKSE